MQKSSHLSNVFLDTLQNFWGYSRFREGQEDIINSIINNIDTLALLPTGGGKSLCYQLPALLMEGTCLVVSPLLALMKDQVDDLKSRGIEAEYLSSELDESQEEEIYQACIDGIVKILYVSPERLKNHVFLSKIDEIQFSFLAIDEAHCISEWGQDFRPSYQQIKQFRNRFKNLPCIALTATATPKVIEDIKSKLELTNGNYFQRSFKRNNIKIFSEEIGDKFSQVFNLLKHNSSSGIIYTRTRKEAEQLTAFLQNKNIKNVDYYHAGLTAKVKQAKQQKWYNSDHQVLVSTNAFGMGIDKDDVRFVIHFSPPASLENYYQEIGRAGRDGQQSFAFMLWNEQELFDLDEAFKTQIPNKKEFLKIISYLYSSCMVIENELPEKVFEFSVAKAQKFTGISHQKIRNVLNFLHNQEVVYYNTLKSFSSLELKFEVQHLESLPKKDAYFIELLLRTVDGLSSGKASVSEAYLCKKLSVESTQLKERLRELHQKEYLDYLDGSVDSIRFLIPREDRMFQGKWWMLFEQIQKNKLLKWEEMKYYLQNDEFCKMRMILAYFGEKQSENCGNCYVCTRKKTSKNSLKIEEDILDVLKNQPCTLDDLSILMQFPDKEKLLEQLIFLLELGKVKMLDFKTYTLK